MYAAKRPKTKQNDVYAMHKSQHLATADIGSYGKLGVIGRPNCILVPRSLRQRSQPANKAWEQECLNA